MLESTGGGRELIDSLLSLARGILPNVAVQEGHKPRKEEQLRPADQLKAIEMLLDRCFGRFTTAARHSPQCLRQPVGAFV